MTPEEITALAREYAEEIYPHEEGEDLGQMEFLRTSAIKHIEASLKMLSHRYCLVEKEKLKAIRFRKVYSAEDVRSKFTEECLIDALFPEIAKEVVG